jgi:hypothetical protein
MTKIYRELENGKIVKGIGLPVFVHNGSTYYCDLIEIYEDGVIDCWGESVDFEIFIEKVNSGWFVTQLPKGDIKINRHHSFYGKTDKLQTYIKEEEFIKEVRDTLDQLQGKTTSSERCRESFHTYLEKPTKSNKQDLRIKYKSVPDHLKEYVLWDMDSRDGAIRHILSGKKIKKKLIKMWKKRYGYQIQQKDSN